MSEASSPPPEPATACPAALQQAFEAHYPALLAVFRAEAISYVVSAHALAAEGPGLRLALGGRMVLLRLRPDGQVGMKWRPLPLDEVLWLLDRHLPANGPFSRRTRFVLPCSRQWENKWRDLK